MSQLSAVHRTQPKALLAVQTALLDCERRIGLLERCFPRNFSDAVARMAQALDQGIFVRPQFIYPKKLEGIERLRSTLHAVLVTLGQFENDPIWALISELLQGRTRELIVELSLARFCGCPEFSDNVANRFVIDDSREQAALSLAQSWLGLGAGCDRHSEQVLLASYLHRRLLEQGLDVPIIERPLSTVAAASRDGIVVRKGARVSVGEAARILVHEVLAHFVPRQRGQHSLAPLQCGTAGACDDEEGRALLLEERHGLLSSLRKHQLAVRHVVARTLRVEPSRFAETCLDLVAQGHDSQLVAQAAARSLRGGGLAREVVYLPSMLAVREHLERAPGDELWMKWGRVSVTAAAALSHWLSENSITHGA